MTDRALTMPGATTAAVPGSSTKLTTQVTVDLHGYHPDQVTCFPLENLIEQAWEIGVDRLRFVHGHGRRRPTGIRVTSFNTGFLGIRIRQELARPSAEMRRYISSTIIDKQHPGFPVVSIRKNQNPTRDGLDLTVLPATRDRKRYELEVAWSEHLRRSAA